MLDKNVPYAGFFMRREPGAPLPDYPLPEGYRYTFFQDGDETNWARIETSVLEFDSEFAALLYFKEHYIKHIDELRRRCIFIENNSGIKVATAMAWWIDVDEQRRAAVHWVSVDPNYQGQGLGKAIISRATKLLTQLNGEVPIYLHTQTWSHKAVEIYKNHSYTPTDEKALYKKKKDNYKKAMKILMRSAERKKTEARGQKTE